MNRTIRDISAPLQARARQSASRFGVRLAAFVMLLAMATGMAQANPSSASYYLTQAKVTYQVTKANYQLGRSYARSGQANTARNLYLSAYSNAISMSIQAAQLRAQNQDTLATGQYHNAQYQQLAVSYATQLEVQVQLLGAYLSLLVQNPLSASLRANVEATMLQIDITLLQLEQAMSLAQA